jgi:hypothetical protein
MILRCTQRIKVMRYNEARHSERREESAFSTSSAEILHGVQNGTDFILSQPQIILVYN